MRRSGTPWRACSRAVPQEPRARRVSTSSVRRVPRTTRCRPGPSDRPPRFPPPCGSGTRRARSQRVVPGRRRQCPGTADQVATLRNCVFKFTMEAIDGKYPPGTFPGAPGPVPQRQHHAAAGLCGPNGDLRDGPARGSRRHGECARRTPCTRPSRPERSRTPTQVPARRCRRGYAVDIYVSDGSLTKTIPDVTGETFARGKHDISRTPDSWHRRRSAR